MGTGRGEKLSLGAIPSIGFNTDLEDKATHTHPYKTVPDGHATRNISIS